MTDKYIGDQKLYRVLEEQFYQYTKHNGNRPTKLIFNSRHYMAKLESEAAEIMFLDVKNTIRRNEFMGMEIILLKDTYGGSFNWGFGE